MYLIHYTKFRLKENFGFTIALKIWCQLKLCFIHFHGVRDGFKFCLIKKWKYKEKNEIYK